MTRAQSNLLALPVALVVVTAVAVGGVAVADAALDGADRTPRTDHAARILAERLVSADASIRSANVLAASRMETLTASRLDRLAPAVAGRPVRVELDGRTLVERGDPRGATVRRAILVADRRSVERTVTLTEDNATVALARTAQVRIVVSSPSGVAVRTVRAGDRVLLHDPGGIRGPAMVRTRPVANGSLRFTLNGTADVTLTTFPRSTAPATLEVTVGEE